MLFFLHDNARSDIAKVVKNYLETLKWDILPQPPHSPDIAPPDYCFFRRMQPDLAGHQLTSFEKHETFFSRWNSKIAWEVEKCSRAMGNSSINLIFYIVLK